MGSPLTELRCKQCNALLAKNDRDGLSIRRGELQATVTGVDVTIAVTCYRCKSLNVLKPSPASTRAAA
ncbi:MAG: hypothetical protein Q8L48_25375 [Archangium sp.]|nr:hypothetical protein [Archangium sp.]